MKIDIGDMIILDSQVFVITDLDEEHGYGEFRYFKSEKEASAWLKADKDKETDKGLN